MPLDILCVIIELRTFYARMVKLVYTYALGAYAVWCAGSSPVPGTKETKTNPKLALDFLSRRRCPSFCKAKALHHSSVLEKSLSYCSGILVLLAYSKYSGHLINRHSSSLSFMTYGRSLSMPFKRLGSIILVASFSVSAE